MPATRCSPASRTPTCPTWPARKRLFAQADALYPMFATHNAHTIAAVHAWPMRSGTARRCRQLRVPEAARHGRRPVRRGGPGRPLDVPCRVYAPVGSHEDLLPYLVRRLLENGANSSFVNRITDEDVAIDDLVRDPVETVAAFDVHPAPATSRCRSTLSLRRPSGSSTDRRQFHGRQPRQRRATCARWPNRSTPRSQPTGAPRRWCRAPAPSGAMRRR